VLCQSQQDAYSGEIIWSFFNSKFRPGAGTKNAASQAPVTVANGARLGAAGRELHLARATVRPHSPFAAPEPSFPS
jgi:hypothetical protein